MLHIDHAIARRYEAAVATVLAGHVAQLARLQPDASACTLPVAGGQALYCGRGTPPGPNRITGAGLDGPVAAADLEAAEDFYLERGLPTVIAINPFIDASLVGLLGSRGYHVRMFRNTLMRRVPAPGIASDFFEPVPGVEVMLAGPDEADAWAQAVGSGFAEQELDGPAVSHLAMYSVPETACYLARVDGVPAGGGAVTFVDGLAYMGDVSTQPSFRRRGVQLAVYRKMLQAAVDAGCDLAGLATEVAHASQRNAERAGFQVAYTGAGFVKPFPPTA
jgi:GNAT superfamily N-acetyltransferase